MRWWIGVTASEPALSRVISPTPPDSWHRAMSRVKASATVNSRIEWIGLPESPSKNPASSRMTMTGSRRAGSEARAISAEPTRAGIAGAL